ncbi:MAG: hypothetical protein E7554_09930 [Ruminococcaceae bacterium]|nr:hypothetical protein [Oscillospiraceae bacterium]
MSIRLIKLILENFKGVQSFVFEPDGQDVTVLGSNGVGKTTLYDAYCWLLFGKDSAGRSDSSFDVKPYGREQPVCTVTGEFDAGAEGCVILQRQLAEKVVRQRGTEETSIKNDYSFHINGVPKPKTQYDQYIAELCPAKYFQMVSDPDYFAGKLKWSDRRHILTELFGEVDERELLSASEEWKPLLTAVEANTIADFRAILTAERKKVRSDLDMIPALISEAEKAIPSEIQIFDPEVIAAAEAELAEAEQRRADIKNGTAVVELKAKLGEAEIDLARSESEYLNSDEYRMASKKVADIDDVRRKALAETYYFEAERHKADMSLEDANNKLDRLRSEYGEIKDMELPRDSETCPHCGQALPPEKLEQIRADFNRRKSERLEANVAAGKAARAEADKAKSECQRLEAELDSATKRLDDAECQLKKAQAEQSKLRSYRDTEEYNFKKALIDSIKKEIEEARADTEKQLGCVDAEISLINRRLAEFREAAAQQVTAERQRRRMDELKGQGRELGRRAAELDKLLDMCARFEQHKLSAIEESVNSRFKYARFKLFDHQLNGGWSECCEVVVDGAPYSTNLNPGKKINAGLDIVSVLSSAIGFSAPVWIDNSESYVSIMDIEAQVIRLKVDSSVDKLTVMQ